jgi:hypothetical protein
MSSSEVWEVEMRSERMLTLGVALLVAMLASGCGRGLDPMVTCNTASQAGEEVECTAMVRNLTDCEVDDVEGFILLFIPRGFLPPDICALIEEEFPSGVAGVESVLAEHLPPGLMSQLAEAAQDRILGLSPQGSGQAFSCTELVATAPSGTGQGVALPQGIAYECFFGDLGPEEKATIMFNAQAPFAGPFDVLALAIGFLDDPQESCPPAPPGTEVVFGCFASVTATSAAPAVSPIGMASLVTVLLGVGAVAVRRRRR